MGNLSQRATLFGYAMLVNSFTLYLVRMGAEARGPTPPETLAA